MFEIKVGISSEGKIIAIVPTEFYFPGVIQCQFEHLSVTEFSHLPIGQEVLILVNLSQMSKLARDRCSDKIRNGVAHLSAKKADLNHFSFE